MSTSHEPPTRAEGLRERHGLSDEKNTPNVTDAGDAAAVEELEKEKKTFGRTPDGTSKFLLRSRAQCIWSCRWEIMSKMQEPD